MPLSDERQAKIMDAVGMALSAIGTPENCPHSAGTPRRVARMLSTILDGYVTPFPMDRMTTFANDGSYKGIVIVHNVPFYSFCAHHLMPFFGHFSLGYMPESKILGLSKLVRAFRHGCKRPTTQEEVTQTAVKRLQEVLGANTSIVCQVTAEHTCMSMRGVQAHGARTTTLEATGLFNSTPALLHQVTQHALPRI